MLSIKRCTLKEGNEESNQKFYYPLIINIYPIHNPNEALITQINEDILQDVQCFKSLIEVEEEVINYSYTDFKVSLKKRQIVSILMHFAEISGSQDIIYVNTYNYDISQNKKLLLNDIFKSDTNYLHIISIDIQNTIKAYREKIESVYTELSFEDINDFIQIYDDQTFYLESDKIIICFSSYELGSMFPKPLEICLLFEDYKEYLTDYAINNIWEGEY